MRPNLQSIKNSQGFSLVEVLIASAILLMVLFIGSYGYNLFARYWQEGAGKFDETFEEMQGLNVLFGIMKDTRPYIIKGGEKGFFHYFEGGKSVVRSFSNSSMFVEDRMAFYELKVEENENNLLNLVYRESVVTENPVIYERDVGSYTNKRVLLRNLNDVSFEFRGWQSYEDWVKRNLFKEDIRQYWYGFYSAKDTLIPPSIVRISFTIEGNTSSIDIALSQFINAQVKTYVSGQNDA